MPRCRSATGWAILQHKAEKALEPVGNLLIGAFEDAMPFLEGGGGPSR